MFTFEARGGTALADRLRGGLLAAAEAALGGKPVRVDAGGGGGSAWRAPGVEVWEVVVGGGGRAAELRRA